MFSSCGADGPSGRIFGFVWQPRCEDCADCLSSSGTVLSNLLRPLTSNLLRAVDLMNTARCKALNAGLDTVLPCKG
jgi:hypothetical protein